MGWLAELDVAALLTLNSWMGLSWSFDQFVLHVRSSHMLKGAVTMMILWGLWFRAEPSDVVRQENRARLLVTILIGCVAIVVGRALALSLPFRARPIHTDGLDVALAAGLDTGILDGWSSMPSDHAVLFFALATGIWSVSRTWGLVAVLHALLVVCLPRVMVGVHFPSDILVGALVGVAVAAVLLRPLSTVVLRWGLLSQSQVRPGLFYALMFAVTFQVASMFDTSRAFLSQIADIIGA